MTYTTSSLCLVNIIIWKSIVGRWRWFFHTDTSDGSAIGKQDEIAHPPRQIPFNPFTGIIGRVLGAVLRGQFEPLGHIRKAIADQPEQLFGIL